MPQGWGPRKPASFPKSDSGKRRVALDPTTLDILIEQQGARVKVYRTTFCPNVKSIDSVEHNIDCQICKGTGFLDAYPIESKALIQTMDFKKNLNVEGMYDGNTVNATFKMGIELQYYTLVELLDYTDIFIELIKRQAGQIDVLKYQARQVNMLIDQDGKAYMPVSDFTLDPNGSIKWVPGRAPLTGKIYTIHYEAAIQFRAIRAGHIHRFLQVSYKEPGVRAVRGQQQWAMSKEFLVKREDVLGNVLNPNKIRDSDES